jgi:glutamyl aminopeptidase
MMVNKVYRELMDLPGVSGFEKPVRNYMKNYINQFDDFEIKIDGIGSVFGYKKSTNPQALTVMVAGHLDEVGFIVSGIDDNGTLKLHPIGGVIAEVYYSQALNVHTKEGQVIKGVIGSIPPHLRTNQSLAFDSFRLDVGASSKADVFSWGINLGDYVVNENDFTISPDKKRIISKAIDNRFGCALALETIKYFSGKELDFNLVVGATVQEEVGLRGAETSVNMIKPDVFIALDASPCNDVFDKEGTKLGNGFLMRVYDPRNIMHHQMLKYYEMLAKKNKIKYQYFTSKGGTDAAKALDMIGGVLATTIAIPTRYIHAPFGVCDLDDIKAARKMLFAVLNDLSSNKIDELRKGELNEICNT